MRDLISARTEGNVCVVIGPEGGIDSLEIDWLKESGFTPCTLGDSIFRSETVPLVVLSIILYEMT
jgi:16S rRNA (uracil1498-N3)-methyltransferase